jgi:hypothetical protein
MYRREKGLVFTGFVVVEILFADEIIVVGATVQAFNPVIIR